MRRARIRLNLPLRLLAVAVMLAGAPAQAQSPAPPEPLWQVDHGEVYCTLGRNYGPEATSFAIRVIPGTPTIELLTMNRTWRTAPLLDGQFVSIALSSGGEPIRTQAITHRLASGEHVLAFFGLGPDFVDRFAQTTSLRVLRGDRAILAFDFPATARVVETLRNCVARTLGDWGIDVAAQARLRALPQRTNTPISDYDYPSAALRADLQGVVIARLAVGIDGRVADCVVVRSSGSVSLDGRTCQQFREEARFSPAIDADGRPVAAGRIIRVMYRIAE
jgi:TonB family protein